MKTARLKWRLFEHGVCLGVLDMDQVAEITGMNKRNISTYADLGSLYKGVYKIERVEDVEKERFMKEWDRATKILKK